MLHLLLIRLLSVSLLALVVAAAWVSTGSALPILSIATMAYVLWGSELDRFGLSMIAHRGYDVPRLVGSMVMGFEGVFGVPLDVAATTIGLSFADVTRAWQNGYGDADKQRSRSRNDQNAHEITPCDVDYSPWPAF